MPRKQPRMEQPERNRVTAHVRELICARGLGAGDLLPPYAEVARELGVSYVTVKRGLDDLEVEGLIHRIPFRGTFVTKELAQVPRDLKHIAVIYASSRNHLFTSRYASEIMSGISMDAPAFIDTHIFSLREDGLIRAAQLGEWDIDGAILLGVENDDYLRTFAQWGTPGVVVDYCSQAAPLDHVACDNAAAARKMVEHLASLGHRRVAYVAGQPRQMVKSHRDQQCTLLVRDSSDNRERRDESLRALQARTMQVEDWTFSLMNPETIATTADKVQRRVRCAEHPTVVLADNNFCALWLLREIENRGLRVPEDISVCAVASDGDMTVGGRTLTCCRFDFTGMGRKAIALLAERRQTKPLDAPREHRIGFEFVEGQTAAAVKKTLVARNRKRSNAILVGG